jgi:hypothetical protein
MADALFEMEDVNPAAGIMRDYENANEACTVILAKEKTMVQTFRGQEQANARDHARTLDAIRRQVVDAHEKRERAIAALLEYVARDGQT